jgi:hypothetical protein
MRDIHEIEREERRIRGNKRDIEGNRRNYDVLIIE